MAAAVLDQSPRVVVELRQWMYSSPGRNKPARPSSMSGALRPVADAMLARPARRPRGRARTLGIEVGAKRERQQLVLGAEISPLQSGDVLRILRGRSGAPVIGIDRADAGFLQRARCRRRCARACARPARCRRSWSCPCRSSRAPSPAPRIGIRRLIGRRQVVLDVAVVVGIEQAVGQDVAQEPLIGMAVGVDEAGNDDSVRGIDDRGRIVATPRCPAGPRGSCRPRSARPRCAKSPTCRSSGEHHAALEQDAAFTLDAGKLGVGGAGAFREAPLTALAPRPRLSQVRRPIGENRGARFRRLGLDPGRLNPPLQASPGRTARTLSFLQRSNALA